MEVYELQSAGHFDTWDTSVLKELQKGDFTTRIGEKLVFENDTIKVWTISLAPKASLKFHKHTSNYNWTVLTNGTAVSHYETGRIVQVSYDKGDLSYYDHDTKGDFVHNLKNIGNTVLEFVTVEYK